MVSHFRRFVAPLLLLASALSACGDGGLGAVGEAEIEVSPSEVSFSQVIMGEEGFQTVTIQNAGTDTLVITDLRVDGHPDLSLDFDFNDRLEIGEGNFVQVTVVWAPTDDQERAEGDLIIVSNDRSEANLAIPIITPPLAPFLTTEPSPIDFGSVVEGTEKVETVTITNRGSAPAVIASEDDFFLTGSPDFSLGDLPPLTFPFTLDVFVPEDPSRQPSISFDITYAPGSPGADEGVLVVRYNAIDQQGMNVEVTGLAVQPGLTVAPNPVDFGPSPLALLSTEGVTLTNTGALQISVDRISLSDDTSDAFTLQGLHPSLALLDDQRVDMNPNQSLPVTIGFTPTQETTYVGTLLIEYYDQGDPLLKSQEVTLVGVGVDNRCPIATPLGFIRDDPQQRRAQQIDWATPTDVLILDATRSTDPDGTIVSYEWEMTRAPEGTTTVLRPLDSDPENDALRQFFIPLSGRYDFTLRVFDDLGFQDCDDPAMVTVLSLPDEAIHVELSWHNPLDPDESDDQGSDADLHLVKIGHNWFDQRFDTYYANQEPDWAPELPSLDIDDTDGGGPENIQMDNPVDCQWYAIGVHYFEEQFGTAYGTIRIYIDSEQIAEFLHRPLDSTDDFWDVGRLHWPTGEFFAIDQIYENFDRSTATPPQITPDMAAAVAGGVCD